MHNVPGIKPTVDYSAALQHLEVNDFLQEVQKKYKINYIVKFSSCLKDAYVESITTTKNAV